MNFISVRLRDQHKDRKVLDELISALLRQKQACDDVWFSSEYGFPKIETHRQFAEMMAEAAEIIRKKGIHASLQISNTIGHDSSVRALDFSGITWQNMIGHDGTVAEHTNCPRDPEFHKYLYEYTKLYASWKPDYVWVDDDLRMANHFPVQAGCFCNRCLKEFSELSGRQWSREELLKELDLHNDSTWREKWVEFNRESLAIVMRKVSEAVYEVSPNSIMGYEHGGFDWSMYTGGDHKTVFDVMKEVSGKNPASRPGAGYYIDHAPRELLYKALSLNLQNSRLPDYVTDRRPEVENFTHTAMGKSPHGTVVEASLHLAYGCNALSFATMMVDHEKIEWHENTLNRIAMWRPYWERYLEHNKDTTPEGLKISYSRSHFKRAIKAGETALNWASPIFQSVPQMATMGVPLCYNETVNEAVILHPDASDGMNEEELRMIFSKGVITDGETIWWLQQRGLAHLTGVSAEPFEKNNAYEKMTQHSMNGEYAGRVWIQYLYNSQQTMYTLSTSLESEKVLGEYYKFDIPMMGKATIAVDTPLGGRLAVFGYNFWEPVVCSARRNQILAAADWICGEKMPVVVETAAQVVVVPRIDKDGKLKSVTILNVSIDYSPEIHLCLRNISNEKAVWVKPIAEDIALEMEKVESGYMVKVPSIAPWSIGYIEI